MMLALMFKAETPQKTNSDRLTEVAKKASNEVFGIDLCQNANSWREVQQRAREIWVAGITKCFAQMSLSRHRSRNCRH